VSDPKPDLGELRRRLALVGRSGPDRPALPFGVPALDAALPGGGLPRGALHEILGLGAATEDAAEGAAFAAGILARLEPEKPILWCSLRADLHAPGLIRHGLAPQRLVLVRAGTEAELLWAMEEGLKCRSLAAVVGEVEALPLTAGRRLQLAAETSGVTAFALRRLQRQAPPASEAQPTAAVTRWRIASCPSLLDDAPSIGRPLWLVELLRCRGGVPARWVMEAYDEAGHVRLPAALANRPAAARHDGERRAAAG
jgi:protein ImuA